MGCCADANKRKAFHCLPLQSVVVLLGTLALCFAAFLVYQIYKNLNVAAGYLVLKSISVLCLVFAALLSLLVATLFVSFFLTLLMYGYTGCIVSQLVETILMWITFFFQQSSNETKKDQFDAWPEVLLMVVIIRSVVLLVVIIISKIWICGYMASLYLVLDFGGTGWEGVGHNDLRLLAKRGLAPERPAYARWVNERIDRFFSKRFAKAKVNPFVQRAFTLSADDGLLDREAEIAELRTKYCKPSPGLPPGFETKRVTGNSTSPLSEPRSPLPKQGPKILVPRKQVRGNSFSPTLTATPILDPKAHSTPAEDRSFASGKHSLISIEDRSFAPGKHSLIPVENSTATPEKRSLIVAEGSSATPENQSSILPDHSSSTSDKCSSIPAEDSSLTPDKRSSIPATRRSSASDKRSSIPGTRRSSASDKHSSISLEGSSSTPDKHSSIPANHSSSMVADDRSSIPADHGSSIPADHGISIPADHGSSIPADDSRSIPADDSRSIPADHSRLIPAEDRSSIPAEHRSSIPAEHSSSIPAEPSSSIPANHSSSIPAKGSAQIVLSCPVFQTLESPTMPAVPPAMDQLSVSLAPQSSLKERPPA